MPRFDPSSRNCTLMQPTLSVQVALTVIVPEYVPLTGDVIATVGAIVSVAFPDAASAFNMKFDWVKFTGRPVTVTDVLDAPGCVGVYEAANHG